MSCCNHVEGGFSNINVTVGSNTACPTCSGRCACGGVFCEKCGNCMRCGVNRWARATWPWYPQPWPYWGQPYCGERYWSIPPPSGFTWTCDNSQDLVLYQ